MDIVSLDIPSWSQNHQHKQLISPVRHCSSPPCLRGSIDSVLLCCLSLFLIRHCLFNSSNRHIFFLTVIWKKCQLPYDIMSWSFWSDPCSFSLDHFFEWCWETIIWTWRSNYIELHPLCWYWCLSLPLCCTRLPGFVYAIYCIHELIVPVADYRRNV